MRASVDAAPVLWCKVCGALQLKPDSPIHRPFYVEVAGGHLL